MDYSRYLFQFGDYIFPLKYIQWDSFDTAPAQRQSLDAYTDANGVTHDNAIEHTKTEIKFKTNKMSYEEWKTLIGNITRNYINVKARDANCWYFDFESCQYKSGHFYLDKSLRISANIVNGEPRIGEVDWTFIEY